MARRYTKPASNGWKAAALLLAFLLACACTFGGLEIFGKGKAKPSNWGKKDAELAPVAISLDGTLANIATFSAEGEEDALPSTKRVTATCPLLDSPTYSWEITGGEGLSVVPMGADHSSADITATQYFLGGATLTAYAYINGELRGIGSIGVYAEKDLYLELITPTEENPYYNICANYIDKLYEEDMSAWNIVLDQIQIDEIEINNYDTLITRLTQEDIRNADIYVFFYRPNVDLSMVAAKLSKPIVILDPSINGSEGEGGVYTLGTDLEYFPDVAGILNDWAQEAGIELYIAGAEDTERAMIVKDSLQEYDAAYTWYNIDYQYNDDILKEACESLITSGQVNTFFIENNAFLQAAYNTTFDYSVPTDYFWYISGVNTDTLEFDISELGDHVIYLGYSFQIEYFCIAMWNINAGKVPEKAVFITE